MRRSIIICDICEKELKADEVIHSGMGLDFCPECAKKYNEEKAKAETTIKEIEDKAKAAADVIKKDFRKKWKQGLNIKPITPHSNKDINSSDSSKTKRDDSAKNFSDFIRWMLED